MKPSSQFVLQVVVLVPYLAALLVPAIHVDGVGPGDPTPGTAVGWHVLLVGWVFPIPWSANFFYFGGWLLLWSRRTTGAVALGTTAAVLGLFTWVFIPVAKLALGAYVWQASLIALPMAGSVVLLCRRHDAAPDAASRNPR